MSAYQRVIKALVIGFAAFLTFSFHSIMPIRSLPFSRGAIQLGSGDLQRDETILVQDMRDLRRHLRHGVDPLMIADERRGIHQDWINIVLDRRPRGIEPNNAMTELARSKARDRFLRRRSS